MRPVVALGFAAGVGMCTLAVACADYPESRTQRPVYSYENVEMGPDESGQEYRGTYPSEQPDEKEQRR